MSKVSVTKEKLDTLAEAVGAKSGQSIPLTISEMTDAVLSIPEINNQNKIITPTESTQTISADSGYSGLGTVTVNAISSSYVGSNVPTNTSGDLTIVNNNVYIPSGYYSNGITASIGTVSHVGPTISLTSSTGLVTA